MQAMLQPSPTTLKCSDQDSQVPFIFGLKEIGYGKGIARVIKEIRVIGIYQNQVGLIAKVIGSPGLKESIGFQENGINNSK
jgi:hypothetical protein